MEKELYSWEQVRAYSIIALHNLLNSANDINLKNMKLFIDPLQTLSVFSNLIYLNKVLKSKYVSSIVVFDLNSMNSKKYLL